MSDLVKEMQSDIFLSYSQEDISKASEIARILEKEGWKVWWDREIKPGQDFETEIDLALSNSKVVVVLWSIYSVSSQWVRTEATEAKGQNKLIPVLLDHARIPLSFRSLSTIKLINWPEKQSILDVSMFKSAIGRVLNDGAGRVLSKPNTADELTLSSRVANRVADLVRNGPDMGSYAKDLQLAFESCISAICLDLLMRDQKIETEDIEQLSQDLKNALKANLVVKCKINLIDSSILEISEWNNSQPASEELKLQIESYVHDFCEVSNRVKLIYAEVPLTDSEILSFPLYPKGNQQVLICFLRESKKEGERWPSEFQRKLYKLSEALIKSLTK